MKYTVPLKVEPQVRQEYKVVAAITGIEMGILAKLALKEYKRKLKIKTHTRTLG